MMQLHAIVRDVKLLGERGSIDDPVAVGHVAHLVVHGACHRQGGKIWLEMRRHLLEKRVEGLWKRGVLRRAILLWRALHIKAFSRHQYLF